MIKKLFFLIVAILVNSTTAVNAKINYVPLYIVDTQSDVKETKHLPAMPLFITQDDHRLTLPEIGDSLAFIVLKDNQRVFESPYQHQIDLPASLIGDFEVRLSADTYYYYGYITLEKQDEPNIPLENANWENITLLGSNSSQEVILANILGLHVVEYNMKQAYTWSGEDVAYLSDEDKEAYKKELEERNAELRAQKRIGLLPDELSAIFPQLVTYFNDGTFGINYMDLIPVLICCIQELKFQLDSRTEAIVDIMSRGSSSSDISSVRAAIGNTLISAATTTVNEPAKVRYLLTDNVSNAYIAVTDMGGRVVTRMPVSPSETSVSIGSGILDEGVFLCTLFADGQIIGTKRLVKTK